LENLPEIFEAAFAPDIRQQKPCPNKFIQNQRLDLKRRLDPTKQFVAASAKAKRKRQVLFRLRHKADKPVRTGS
jgi:hypothetical protein